MRFILEQNLLSSPGESWHHVATFIANSLDEARAIASRWASYHGGANVRVQPTSYLFALDDFMEKFRP